MRMDGGRNSLFEYARLFDAAAEGAGLLSEAHGHGNEGGVHAGEDFDDASLGDEEKLRQHGADERGRETGVL